MCHHTLIEQWEEDELRLDSKYRQVQRWKLGGFIACASESASQLFVTVEASYPPETSENPESHQSGVEHSSISVWHMEDEKHVRLKLTSLRNGMPALTTELKYLRVAPREPAVTEFLEQAQGLRERQELDLMRAWLTDFYSYYNPDQLETVEQTASNFAGREPRLVQILTKKYQGAAGQVGEVSLLALLPSGFGFVIFFCILITPSTRPHHAFLSARAGRGPGPCWQ